MKTRDKVALLLAGAALVVGGVLLWPRGDGAALARVGALRRGMSPTEIVRTLHPDRSEKGLFISYQPVLPSGTGRTNVFDLYHPLGAGRTLYARVRGYSDGTMRLQTWRVEEKRAPFDSFSYGGPARTGGFHLPPFF